MKLEDPVTSSSAEACPPRHVLSQRRDTTFKSNNMAKSLLVQIKKFPFIGAALVKIKCLIMGCPATPVFKNSEQYWEARYRMGGDSGAGSYGRLARFKAAILNEFVKVHGIINIVEYGCGDGAQLALAEYPQYSGFDVSPFAVKMCRTRFANNDNYEFFEMIDRSDREGFFDLAISLDVIYHLIEDEVFNTYMKRLFTASHRYVIIYSYNFERQYESPHERGREFLTWCNENAKDWALINVVNNLYPYNTEDPSNTSQSDFFIFRKII